MCLLLAIVLSVGCIACGGPKDVTDMTYTATMENIAMGGVYTGTVEKQLPNGQGTFTYLDDSKSITYSGQWENGVPSGDGHLEYDGFQVQFCDVNYIGEYEGEAIDGIPGGTGTFTNSNENAPFIYTGEWKNGIFAGEGYLECDEITVEYCGDTYKGNFEGNVVDGLPHGDGSFVSSNENSPFTYIGEWQEGMIAGKGTIEFGQLSVTFNEEHFVGKYTGDVVDGLPSGIGDFAAETEDSYLIYSGNWLDGNFSGSGTLDTNIYQVNFKDGVSRIGEYVGEVNNGLCKLRRSHNAHV